MSLDSVLTLKEISRRSLFSISDSSVSYSESSPSTRIENSTKLDGENEISVFTARSFCVLYFRYLLLFQRFNHVRSAHYFDSFLTKLSTVLKFVVHCKTIVSCIGVHGQPGAHNLFFEKIISAERYLRVIFLKNIFPFIHYLWKYQIQVGTIIDVRFFIRRKGVNVFYQKYCKVILFSFCL